MIKDKVKIKIQSCFSEMMEKKASDIRMSWEFFSFKRKKNLSEC